MLQIAEIVLAILGLVGSVPIEAVCWTVIGCELCRSLLEMVSKR